MEDDEDLFIPNFAMFETELKCYTANIKEIWNRCMDKYETVLLRCFLMKKPSDKTMKHKYNRAYVGYNHNQVRETLYEQKMCAMIRKIKFYNKKFLKRFWQEFTDEVNNDVEKLLSGEKLKSKQEVESLYEMCSDVLNLNLNSDYELIFYKSMLSQIEFIPRKIIHYEYQIEKYHFNKFLHMEIDEIVEYLGKKLFYIK